MKKTVVITGGSSGIGRSVAIMFNESGYKVFELSRHGNSHDGIVHIDTDVSNVNSIKAAFEQISEQTNAIDILIINAGVGLSGATEFIDVAIAKNLFEVNFFGAVNTVKYALPMVKAAKGRIVTVSSVAGALPVPFQTYYSASKAALNSYSYALENELKRFGVSVSVILPGDVKTRFSSSRIKLEEGTDIYKGAVQRSVGLMERDEQKTGMTAQYVANKVYKTSIKKRCRLVVTVGTKYRFYVFLSKIFPMRLVNYIIGSIYAK